MLHGYASRALDLDDPSDCKLWDEYASRHPKGHHHYCAFLRAIKKAYNHQHLSQFLLREGQVVGILPLFGIKSPIFGNQLVSLPFYNYGGPLADTEQGKTALFSVAEHLMIEHDYQRLQLRCDDRIGTISGDSSHWSLSTHKANMTLTLPESFQKIGAGNAKKRAKLRSQATLAVRKAEEEEVTLTQIFGGAELLNDFYKVFSEHMRDLGTPVYGKGFFSSMLEQIPSEITVVYWGGKPVACGFLFKHGGERVSIPWASTLVKMNYASVNAYMYGQILQRCIEQGQTTFDFGRSTVDAGTYKFKAQWGAEPEPCYWYEYTGQVQPDADTRAPSEGKFGLLVRVWKKLPLLVSNTVGPFIIKQIP